jgi:hypothetical protein
VECFSLSTFFKKRQPDLGYPMDPIALGVEETACTILEQLTQKLSGANVDYERFDSLHNFIIEQDGTRFRVQFTEQTLLRKNAYEIEEAVHKVVERVLCATSPRVLRKTA